MEYLQEKYNKLMILYNLIKKCKIEGIKIFDYYPDLLNEFFKIFEKIIVGINIRKQENIHLEKIEKEEQDAEQLITLFLETFYREMKNNLGNNKDFNHLLLFGKISNINEKLLTTLFHCFINVFKDKNKKRDNKSYYSRDNEINNKEQKDNLLLFIINIIIGINIDIQKLLKELNKEINNKNMLTKYKDGLWYLSSNNYICKNYLLQILNDINLWKTQIYKDSKIDEDTIFLLAEQLHFLFKKYLLIGNNSLKDKSDYIDNQKTINNIMLNYDIDKAYYLSKQYLDHFTMAKIAFNDKNKYYQDLKVFMKTVLSKKRGHIKYLLQLILEFEMQYIHNCIDKNQILFNYFDEFEEFQKEIEEISRSSKKLQNFYNLYLLKKNIENKINESNGHNIVQNIVHNMTNNDIIDFNGNKIKLDNLIKIICLDKALNLIKNSYLNNNEEIDINMNLNSFIQNITEDNIIYEILQLCNDKNYKNILNIKGEPKKTFYEKSFQFLKDYFDNYIIPSENQNEVKENCYIVLFLLNECIKNNKIPYNILKLFIGEICNKCIILDNDFIFNKLNENDEHNIENENQKMNLIYRMTAEHSIVIKLSKCFKNFNEIFLASINDIKEEELNKSQENRILHLLDFVTVLYNLIKPENMDNSNYKIDNRMEEEEDEIIN